MILNGKLVLSILLLTVGYTLYAQTAHHPIDFKEGIIPKPKEMLIGEGRINLKNGVYFQSYEHQNIREDLDYFVKTKTSLNIADKDVEIAIRFLSTENYELGSEGYELIIDENGITITAPSEVGLFHGATTLKQLILLNAQGKDCQLPFLLIKDSPKFQHRGLLLDCSRHFFEVGVVKKYIDLLSFFKMNVLHWHITEDQGWRIKIDKYPRLTSVGAYRVEQDGTIYGGFYTKEEIKEVVTYAAAKHITVIPEIELPGHSQAAIASYPHLSCTGDSVPVANDWGVFKEIYCAGNDSTFMFLEDVLIEVMELFPSKHIHIGGDEAPKVRWEQCSKCQKRMEEESLADEAELQSYFIQRIQSFLQQHNRSLIGWDEILEGGLAEGAIVQSWRGMEGGIEAVKHGHQAIMSPTSHAYLDYGLDAIDLKKVYGFQPIPEELSEEEAQLIIGGECNMWTEHVPDEATLDSRVFPRLLAMSEVLWSEETDREYAEFNERVQAFYPILDQYNIAYGEEAIPISYNMLLEENRAWIQMRSNIKNVSYEYRYDFKNGEDIHLGHEEQFEITATGTLSIQAYKNERDYGETAVVPFTHHKGINTQVEYDSEISQWYTAGGEKALVDAKRGTLNFRDGSWQGFWGEDLHCTLEFDDITSINEVTANFYQYNNSWIFIPTAMSVEVSSNGKDWISVGTVESNSDPKQRGKFVEEMKIEPVDSIEAKYIRIRVENFGKVPDWHEAAGSDAWIFIDEIIVR